MGSWVRIPAETPKAGAYASAFFVQGKNVFLWPMNHNLTQPIAQTLVQMAHEFTHQEVTDCEQLAQSGSHRLYFRLTLADQRTIMGAYNDDVAENDAFFYLTRFFRNLNLNVPELFVVAPDKQYYLQEDLGRTTLYDFLTKNRQSDGRPTAEVVGYYEKVVRALPDLQLAGKQGMDFSIAYPRHAFDRQSMLWDLNYFKYYFLKLVNVPFNEQRLEDDFNKLMDYLLAVDSNYFLYRDFQSRNIMVKDGNVYFIDYQGGRKGAPQYDIASLLYDAKADLSPELRDHLFNIYLDALSQHVFVDRADFECHFQGFVLIRILQAMGAYGYRGYFEHKSHFLQSVPYAVRNIMGIVDHWSAPVQLPELFGALRAIAASDFVKPYQPGQTLTVLVQSFSYKKSIPQDPSPNGGGFVFDCRALPNPGREKRFAHNTGKDDCVIEYLEKYPAVAEFKAHAYAILDQAVDNYIERNFDHLMVSFGCTGGQHRSVYFAEQMAKHLRDKYTAINVVLNHTAQ